jgi:multidrug efflux pump subunit AcrA (membrane-fusion protein)
VIHNFLQRIFICLLMTQFVSATELSPLFKETTPKQEPFSTMASGYGALSADGSHVAVYVSKADAGRVRPGASALVQLGAPEGIPKSVAGHVINVMQDADPRTGQAIVTLEIPNQGLPARTYAAAAIVIAARQALAVPTTAVLISSGTAFVYRLEPSLGTYERTPVKIGVQGPEFTEIKRGLSPADRVLSQGAIEKARQETSNGGDSGD